MSLEESFEVACSNGTIPGAVLLATDKTGIYLDLIITSITHSSLP